MRRQRKRTGDEGVAAEMPRDVVDRIERVRDYHNSSKHTYASVRTNQHKLDWASQPSPFRVFEDLPKVESLREGMKGAGNAAPNVRSAEQPVEDMAAPPIEEVQPTDDAEASPQ